MEGDDNPPLLLPPRRVVVRPPLLGLPLRVGLGLGLRAVHGAVWANRPALVAAAAARLLVLLILLLPCVAAGGVEDEKKRKINSKGDGRRNRAIIERLRSSANGRPMRRCTTLDIRSNRSNRAHSQPRVW